MCGIFCFISNVNSIQLGDDVVGYLQIQLEQCKCLINNRGPDATDWTVYDSRVLLFSAVLWQQGAELSRQPVDGDRYVLLFNGDLFNKKEDRECSDTLWLYKTIDAIHDISQIFRTLLGSFSVILVDKILQRVYFARDSLGRNSLLLGRSKLGIFISSALAKNSMVYDTIELPPNGVYFVDLTKQNSEIKMLPWSKNLDVTNFIAILDESFFSLPWHESTIIKENFDYHNILKNIEKRDESLFDFLLSIPAISKTCEELIRLLEESIEERIINTPKYCKQCIRLQNPCEHARIGILFSGGIDCAIISLIADRFVDQNIPIDLLNVAFEKINREKPLNVVELKSTKLIDWNVPDRCTAKQTLIELQRLKSSRKWQLVEINVTRQELESNRQRISDLVFPLKTVLDESLGAALWFASRGVGILKGVEYSCQSRVLIVGSGADELFGGYSRHKAAFYRNLSTTDLRFSDNDIQEAYNNLTEELELDWKRLPSRNLARDDRIICDHGVTPRTPYLQEGFVSFVKSLKASQKCYHPLGAGIGDKLILRLCGYKLGLKAAAFLKKRALQFGSKVADRKQNASDNSSFLQMM
ncbi:asparagine synthetase domain-containing protein CG17486 isoform X2 [Wyeomyia smithii]|uniref:asparagine synthetase domain-containing protein CG17486 isoform X2 n=1 Tax=Wyeomyia smithii TaxID=174621 RepID=UPI0024681C75|nr:asparagine synthetase domain-containing protein CG17486 isoform X2 [Wyeomyia smithii]